MTTMTIEDEAEYIAAIGAVRCLMCANYHFDDTAICWHCQDEVKQAQTGEESAVGLIKELLMQWQLNCPMIDGEYSAIVDTIDGEYSW